MFIPLRQIRRFREEFTSWAPAYREGGACVRFVREYNAISGQEVFTASPAYIFPWIILWFILALSTAVKPYMGVHHTCFSPLTLERHLFLFLFLFIYFFQWLSIPCGQFFLSLSLANLLPLSHIYLRRHRRQRTFNGSNFLSSFIYKTFKRFFYF